MISGIRPTSDCHPAWIFTIIIVCIIFSAKINKYITLEKKTRIGLKKRVYTYIELNTYKRRKAGSVHAWVPLEARFMALCWASTSPGADTVGARTRRSTLTDSIEREYSLIKCSNFQKKKCIKNETSNL